MSERRPDSSADPDAMFVGPPATDDSDRMQDPGTPSAQSMTPADLAAPDRAEAVTALGAIDAGAGSEPSANVLPNVVVSTPVTELAFRGGAVQAATANGEESPDAIESTFVVAGPIATEGPVFDTVPPAQAKAVPELATELATEPASAPASGDVTGQDEAHGEQPPASERFMARRRRARAERKDHGADEPALPVQAAEGHAEGPTPTEAADVVEERRRVTAAASPDTEVTDAAVTFTAVAAHGTPISGEIDDPGTPRTSEPAPIAEMAKGRRKKKEAKKGVAAKTVESAKVADAAQRPGAAALSEALATAESPVKAEPPVDVVPAKTGDKEQRNTTVPAVRRSSRAGAVALLVVVALAGLGTATVAGRQWGSVVNQRDRQSFDRRAQTVAARVASVLQRDADVTTTAASIEAQDPQLSNAGLSEWFTTLTTGHVPNALGATFIQPVLDYQLALYRVLVDSDPTSALRSGGSFSILPSTATSPYCLTRLLALDPAVRSAGDAALPPGLDWCATPAGSALSAARDTGTPAVAKVVAPDEGTLTGLEPAGKTPDAAQIQTLKSIEGALGQAVVFFAPVYSQTAPATEAARLASFEGWVGGIFDTGTVLAGAGVGHNALNVTLAARNPGAALTTVASEDAVTTATTLVDSVHTQAGGRWVITVARPPVTGWASGTRQGLVVGGVIVLATLAVLGVMGVLLRRRRAVVAPPAAVVAERAGDVDHMALHDLLTGLPTRPLIVDRTEQMLARSRRSKLPMAVLVMDLDGMDAFNERHGRARGDELLTAVAERLVAVLREADTVGRQDGDEFVVLTDGASLTAGPELVAERLIGVLREPFHLGEGDDEPVSISASVGIALGPRIDAASLLEDAHTALTEAKAAGGARYSLFGQDMPMALEGRKAFETELRIAVASDQFFLRYQPIFDIDTRTTTGVEALLRWQHPTRRVIPPDHFLPVLEETGLILPLGRWVLLEACRQGALLHAKGYRIAMSVNVSARQLESETIVDDVRDALDETSFAAHALVIEVTETTLMRDTALMVERLIALKSLGVRIAIDDFGTGYSTPAYLRQFPIDILKIDRSFISSMITTRDSSMLIHTLVQFGKTLGLETIAEGIEEEGQLDPLLAEQCDTGQGFLYGRPLSPTQLDIFLRTHLTQEPPLWVVPPMQGTR